MIWLEDLGRWLADHWRDVVEKWKAFADTVRDKLDDARIWLEAVGQWLADRWRDEVEEWKAFLDATLENLEEARFWTERHGIRLAAEADLEWPFRWSKRYWKRRHDRESFTERIRRIDFGPLIRTIASLGVTAAEAAENIRSFARAWRRLEEEMKRKGASDGTP